MLLESHLQLVFKKKTNFVGSKTLNFNLKFVTCACKIERTMNKLKPFIDNILYETAIPIMLISQRDMSLFHEEPIEYIRKSDDLIETIYMPKVTCVNLIQYVCAYKSVKKQKKPDYLIPFLTFATNNMTMYNDEKQKNANPDWRIKEALLFAVGSLCGQIAEQKELNKSMEPMLMTHVMPELNSDQPFLRSRACWVYGEFGDY